ncbi:hypothetical protein CASFOL_027776 [Castilleja foliolosa]|uniref:F-box domain-containing protein n=1 Tax=Castilleja foliolosa TaxID=1961234 RepID=A0ABD3CFS1_9LAMI
MPPKRNHRPKNNKQSISGPVSGAMADCILPQGIMFSIVTRLPVKSIHRFKCVCKPWLKLFSSPKFMKAHHTQLSQNPENQSVMVYCFSEKNGNTMSLYRTELNWENPNILDHPFPKWLQPMDFVGGCNGLICLSYPPLGQWIELWNPALKKAKSLPSPKLKAVRPAMVSIGFGYDDESDDFKVVRIVSVDKEKKKKKISVGVEVYSVNSNSWKTINVGFQFSVLETRNDVVVNEKNLYWVAKVDKDDDENEVLLWFDVKKMKFKVVSLSSLNLDEEQVAFVDWKGAIAALVCNSNDERVLSLDVWVFDDSREIWIKNRSFGSIELKVDRFLRCLKSGEIVGECPDGKLFVLDENNGSVKNEIVIDDSHKRSFEIYEYTESLAYVQGMKKWKEKIDFEGERKLADLYTFLHDFANRNELGDGPHEITFQLLK